MEYAGRKILVVDDENGIRDLFKRNLEEQGYTCRAAPDGNTALELLAAEELELAMIDIMMPGMTGLSLFQRIKNLYPDMAVIFVTAVDELDTAVENVRNGAYDYLVKPVRRQRLRQAIEEALGKRRALLKEKGDRQHLDEQIASQAQDLEARGREISALNRFVQVSLSEVVAEEQSAHPNPQTLHKLRKKRHVGAA